MFHVLYNVWYIWQVHVWDVSQQYGVANAFRQGSSRRAMEMSFKCTSMNPGLDLLYARMVKPVPCQYRMDFQASDFIAFFVFDSLLLQN